MDSRNRLALDAELLEALIGAVARHTDPLKIYETVAQNWEGFTKAIGDTAPHRDALLGRLAELMLNETTSCRAIGFYEVGTLPPELRSRDVIQTVYSQGVQGKDPWEVTHYLRFACRHFRDLNPGQQGDLAAKLSRLFAFDAPEDALGMGIVALADLPPECPELENHVFQRAYDRLREAASEIGLLGFESILLHKANRKARFWMDLEEEYKGLSKTIVLLREGFANPAAVLERWWPSPDSAPWEIRDGNYIMNAVDREGKSILRQGEFSNFFLRCRVLIEYSKCEPCIMFWAQDHETYYEISLNKPNRQILAYHKAAKGEFHPIARVGAQQVVPGIWLTVWLRAESDSIKVWLDGEQKIEYALPRPPTPTSGTVGFRGGETRARFRDLLILKL